MTGSTRTLRLAGREGLRPAGAGRRGDAGAPRPARAGAIVRDGLLLATCLLAVAGTAKFVPAAREVLVPCVGAAVLLVGRRSFHLGAALYALFLPFLDLLPRQLFDVPALNPRNLMLAALVALILLGQVRREPDARPAAGKAVWAAFIAVFAWMFVGIAIAYYRHSVPLGFSFDLWWNSAMAAVPVMLGAVAARQGERPRLFFLGSLLVSETLVSAWALGGHLSKVASGADPARLRSAGMLGQPNSFGAFLALALPALVALAAGARGLRLRLAGAVGMLVCLTCLANTLSRGSMLAAAAAFVVLGVVRFRMWLVGAVVLALFAGPWLVPAIVTERFNQTFEGSGDDSEGLDHSAETRIEMYELAPAVYAGAPIIGHGLGAYPAAVFRIAGQGLARSPHSWYIEVFTEMGIVGAALFAWLTLAIAAALWRMRRFPGTLDPTLGSALFASTVALAVVCFFQKPFVDNELILPLYFAALGAAIGVGPQTLGAAPLGPRPVVRTGKE